MLLARGITTWPEGRIVSGHSWLMTRMKRMFGQGQGGKWMIVAGQTNGLQMPDGMDKFNGRAGLLDPESSTLKDVLVADSVEILESVAEFEFLSIDGDGSPGAFAFFTDVIRQGIGIDAQEPTNTGAFQFQKAGSPVVGMDVNDISLHLTENPDQHIKEVNTNIGGNASGFLKIPFPGSMVPITAGSHIGEIDVRLFVVGWRSRFS